MTHERAPVAVSLADATRPPLLATFDRGEYLEARPDGQSEILRGLQPESFDSPDVINGMVRSDPGALAVQYEGGQVQQREAAIVDDPVMPGNRVLGFFLREANVVTPGNAAPKGRIQLNAYDTEHVRARELLFSTRMYLAQDLEALRLLPTIVNWLTISEWWNDAGWTGQAYPFRISINIVKPVARRGSPLNFRASAQTKDAVSQEWSRTVWQVTNRTIQVPTGKWVTLEVSYRQGDLGNGRFHVTLTPDGGLRTTLFDVRSWTQHPDDPAPDGVTHINPVKLYTSREVIDQIRNSGGQLAVFWDDLSLLMCEPVDGSSSSKCAPGALQVSGPPRN